jgi:hypothetical protein
MSTFQIDDDEIDAEQIMEAIRNNIQKRKHSGAYNDSLPEIQLKEAKKLKLDTIIYEVSKDFEYITMNYGVQNKSYIISSHRRLLGYFLVKGRKLVNGEVKRYFDPTIVKQNEFNACIVRIFRFLLGKSKEDSLKLREMNLKQESLDNKISELDKKVEELNSTLFPELDDTVAKISELDKKVEELNSTFFPELDDTVAETPWGEYYSGDIKEEDLIGNINHHDFFISLIEEYAQKASGNHVPKLIEVGIGTATMSIYFSRKSYEVLGLDNDINVIFNAMDTNERLGGHAKFVMMDANDLKYMRKQHFDISFSQGVLEHYDNKGILRMLSNQLEIAKYVVFSVPSIHYPKREFGNERKMTVEEWESILQDAGFNVLRVDYYRENTQIACVVSNEKK